MVDALAYYYLIGVAFVAALLIRGFGARIAAEVRRIPIVTPALVPVAAILVALIVIFALGVLAALWPWGVYDELTKGRS